MSKELPMTEAATEQEPEPSVGEKFFNLIQGLRDGPDVSWNGETEKVKGMAVAVEVWSVVGEKIRNPERPTEQLMARIENEAIRAQTLDILNRLFPPNSREQ